MRVGSLVTLLIPALVAGANEPPPPSESREIIEGRKQRRQFTAPARQGHGIFRHVRRDEQAIASAAKRAHLYMHSAARRRAERERQP